MIGQERKSKSQPVLEAPMERRIVALPAGAAVLPLLPALVIEKAQVDAVVEHVHELLA